MKKKLLIALAILMGILILSFVVAPDWANDKVQKGMNNAKTTVEEIEQ